MHRCRPVQAVPPQLDKLVADLGSSLVLLLRSHFFPSFGGGDPPKRDQRGTAAPQVSAPGESTKYDVTLLNWLVFANWPTET